MPVTQEASPPPTPPAGSRRLWSDDQRREFYRTALVICAGILFVKLGYQTGIAKLPIRYLLKDELFVAPALMASFFAIAEIPSFFKFLPGLISDSVPLMGTHRRHYLIFASLMTGLLWLLLGVVPRDYQTLLWVTIGINMFVTTCGTITGGYMVQKGKEYNATGRFTSMWNSTRYLGALLAGPIGGILATKAFGIATASAAVVMFSLALVAWLVMKEPPVGERDPHVWRETGRQVKVLFRSGPLWAAGGLFFLATIAPGFSTPLFYFQTEGLNFTAPFIGTLEAVSAVMWIVAGFIYALTCKRFRLLPLLVLITIFHSLAALLFLWYRGPGAAVPIEAFYGLMSAFSFLVLFDFAARATPKGMEALGYSLMFSVISIAGSISDVLGSWIFELFARNFFNLVWLNAITSALVLVAIPFLPRRLVNRKEGEALGE
jgi:hypothetical protein